MQLAAQTIRRGRIVSARREPSGTLVILTAKLSLSYALRILFLYRVHLRYWRLLVEPFHFILTKVKGSFKCYVMFKKKLKLDSSLSCNANNVGPYHTFVHLLICADYTVPIIHPPPLRQTLEWPTI